ncbi:MAG: phosphoribosylglycinamide synthetase C domain-containing protein, partial [Sphaerobacter sp.]|nr:phosphoribosylglycinamide synthetase C domain-containing protein [Sphaerobacter sp.]
PACDYKRVGDGDRGPNTGGMGAYAPVPAVGPALVREIVDRIIRPTVAEMRRRGIIYRGILYAGLILTADGPKVLEFNCRMGDPETQVVLPLLDGDLATLLDAAARGHLGDVPAPRWHPGACVGLVLASGGYPGSYTTGHRIEGLDSLPEGVIAFHAGTAVGDDGAVVTASGRVLTLVARGQDFAEARERVYEAAGRVTFADMYYRRDIALRETPSHRDAGHDAGR